ncbi:MAG: aminoacyl-histidine dipeptidase [Prevotellaceae bacterium]|jgi:dipeptidase D|nr:aminoacyl-histidine dipeptidase [Prevotellaceae bacterium]
MSNIANLEPQCVWKHFDALTQIPRPSTHEQKAVEFVAAFGKKLGLETTIDETGNVLIRKPATKGMENRKSVILQSHLDMVPQKNVGTVHDFEKDPIRTYIDGEWVKARGTTLGADNGIGVAAAMAVLEAGDISHGAIEALFTVDEETGMTGAFGLKPDLLKGDILINLDSEDEGELFVGCAGGINGSFTFTYKETPVPAGHEAFTLSVTGLKGGHSGLDIILGRGNANKILFRILHALAVNHDIRLASIDGGNLRNAIPREAFAVFTIPAGKATAAKRTVESVYQLIAAELLLADEGLRITVEPAATPPHIFDEKTQQALIAAVYATPNGVIRMSDAVPGLVETSTNLAIVKSENDTIVIRCLLRSSVNSAKDDLTVAMGAVFTLAGATSSFDGGYPGWKPDPSSTILQTMVSIYKQLYGVEPKIAAVHAGLECGLIGGLYPQLDMISCGPTLLHPHSPDEKLEIATVEKWWIFLLKTLENVPIKKNM